MIASMDELAMANVLVKARGVNNLPSCASKAKTGKKLSVTITKE